MMKMASKRRTDLDFVKGVLIFIVIWGHVCPNSSSVEYTQTWCAFARITAMFAMPLFFMLSGFFLRPADSLSKLWLQFRKSFWRLVVPFLIWGLIASIFRLKMWNVHDLGINGSELGLLFLSKRIIGYIIGFYWYISALILCILLGQLLFFVKSKINRKVGWAIIFCSIVLVPCIPTNFVHFTFVWPFYILGSLMNNCVAVKESYQKVLTLPIYLIIVIALGCAFWGYFLYPSDTFYYSSYNPLGGGIIVVVRYAMYLLSTICALILLQRLYKNKKTPFTDWIAKTGRETLFLYMCHMVVLFHIYNPIVLSLTNNQGMLPEYPFIRFYVISTIIAIILFVVLYKLSEITKKNKFFNTVLMGNHIINKN